VRAIRVRCVADIGLVGDDEIRAVAFAVAGAIGTWLGMQLSSLLGVLHG
jgi:ribosomal protein L2